MQRRTLLKSAGALSILPLAHALVPGLRLDSRAMAANLPEDRFFVLIRVHNGLDVTLGLDPWLTKDRPLETDMYIEYRPEDVLEVAPGLKLGPACEGLKNHAGDISVVNGVFLSQVDNGHLASMLYISTGTTASTAPTLPVELARASREGDFGILTNAALDMGNRTAITSALDDLKYLPQERDLTSVFEKLYGQITKNTSFIEAIRRVISSESTVRQFIEILNSFGPSDKLLTAQVMAAAFKAGTSYCAQFDINKPGLDSHADHPVNHLNLQKEVWTEIGDIFALFKSMPGTRAGVSLFEQTTFMVISEFARTPALNSARGKDHNPLTNSVLLAGRGVRKGLTIGASRSVGAAASTTGSPYHIAYPIDYATGEVQYQRTDLGQMIFPENVAQTVARILGVDAKKFGSIAPDTQALDRLIL